MKRRRTPTVDPAIANRDAKVAEQAEVIGKFKTGINALIDSHAPRMDASAREHVHPGWSDRGIDFYCERCRTAWPCQTINDLRALYGTATDWEPATIPYAPLRLHLAEKPETQDLDD